MRKKEIKQLYEEAEDVVFPRGSRLLLICINKTIEDSSLTMLQAVQYSWIVSPTRAEAADCVLAVGTV